MKWTKAFALLGTATALSGMIWAEDEPKPKPEAKPDTHRSGGDFNDPQRRQQFQLVRQGMSMLMPVSLFATDKFVYVLRGDTLYQFKADTLEPVKKTALPAIAPLGGAEQP